MEYQCGNHVVTVDDDCEAIYIYLNGKPLEGRNVSFTRSMDDQQVMGKALVSGMVNADYSEEGKLLGVEIIL